MPERGAVARLVASRSSRRSLLLQCSGPATQGDVGNTTWFGGSFARSQSRCETEQRPSAVTCAKVWVDCGRLKVRTNPWQSVRREPVAAMRAATRGAARVCVSRKWLARRQRRLGTSVIPLTNETLTCAIAELYSRFSLLRRTTIFKFVEV